MEIHLLMVYAIEFNMVLNVNEKNFVKYYSFLIVCFINNVELLELLIIYTKNNKTA